MTESSDFGRYFMAIDPGASGAVAWTEADGVQVANLPETPHEYQRLWDEDIHWHSSEWFAILEKVHSMPARKKDGSPAQGIASTFKFGKHAGMAEQLLASNRIPYELVSPQKWQKHFTGLPADKAERKREIKRRMQARYPHLKVTLTNADALAMLTYLVARERQ